MKKIDKVKEWVLINYTKKIVLKKYYSKLDKINEKFLLVPKMEYYKSFNNCYEWEIVDEIIENIDKNFTLTEEEINKTSFFVQNYIKVLIPEFRKTCVV